MQGFRFVCVLHVNRAGRSVPCFSQVPSRSSEVSRSMAALATESAVASPVVTLREMVADSVASSPPSSDWNAAIDAVILP